MKISVFGAGYVGLVTGACFADLGNEVLCCDVDPEKIKKLNSGQSPFYEPGLSEMAARNTGEKRLRFSTEAAETVRFGEVIFIAVGTPPKPTGEADLSYVYAVAESIGRHLDKDDAVVITKSTVPVGTTMEVKKKITAALKTRGVDFKFSVASNPEFLREGKALEDFMIPDRVVVGIEDEQGREVMDKLYFPQTKNGHPLYFLDIASSEMAKYASNTFIAARISLINEISQICEAVGADIEKVRSAVGADKRIGQKYIYPGVGYGGSCFPKDIQALSAIAKKHGIEALVTDAIEAVNERQKSGFAEKIITHLKNTGGRKLAVWGLSFKPHTDDMRAAPALDVIDGLLSAGFTVSAYDPVAMENAKNILKDKVIFAPEMYAALEDADALAIITEWPQFKEPDFTKIKQLLKTPTIFDGRNIYEPKRMKTLGFTYISVGRPQVN